MTPIVSFQVTLVAFVTPKASFQVALVAFVTSKASFQVALVAFVTSKASFQVALVAFVTSIVSSAVARRPQLSSLRFYVSLFSNTNQKSVSQSTLAINKSGRMFWRDEQLIYNGKYKIEKYLGGGGFAVTYQAMHTKLNRRVVIKTTNNSDRKFSNY